MKVAVVHDWLTGMRGGEKVLEQILMLFPGADIFTLICDRGSIPENIKKHKIKTSFLQGIPWIFRTYRNFLPLFPLAIESLDMKGYDLIISSSHCAAKGIRPKGNAKHVCYCHAPMRYAWDQFSDYFSPERNGRLKYAAISALMPGLRDWDVLSSKRVDFFIANSTVVQARIKKYYGRESSIVHPPVNTEFYTPLGDKEDFFLMVSAITEYKKVDFAVDVFNGLPDKKLVVIGKGPLLKKISASAKPNITMLGYLTDEEIRGYYRRAKAFIFPGEEDFGITMAESLSCGTPVLCLNKGGALDIVADGETGEFFDGTREGFIKTLDTISNKRYDIKKMRESAIKFSENNFCGGFMAFLGKNGLA